MVHSTSGSKYLDPANFASLLDVKALEDDLFLSADVRVAQGERGMEPMH